MAGGVSDLVFTVLGIDKASKTFDNVGASMERMASRGSKATTMMAGSSAAGAAAIAGSMALVPLAFAGIGAAAVKENAAVRDAFRDLGTTVRSGLAADAEPMAETFVGVAGEIKSAFTDLRPELRRGFVEAKPHVEALTRGVTVFAREAVPGMVNNIAKAGPVFAGLESMLGDLGRGTGDFFDIVADGAPGAGAFFEDLGDLSRDALPDVARGLVELTELWEVHGDQAVRVIAELLDVVVDLGTSAMPIASSAMGVGLDVLEGILTVVGPLADQLGPLVGIWLSMGLAMRTIGSVTGVIQGVTDTVANLRKESGTAAGPTGLGRVGAAASGVMGMLGGPWGLAVTAAAVGLAMFGQESQDAANDQRSLSGALKESSGAFDANARSTIMNSEQYKEMADNVEKAGFTHSELLDAVTKGGSKWDQFKARVQGVIDAETKYTDNGEAMIVATSEKGEAAGFLSGQLNNLRSVVTGAVDAFEDEKQAVGSAAEAMVGAVPGSDSLNAALKTLSGTTGETADRADALNSAWQQMFGQQISLEEATAGYLQGLADLREQIDGVKGSVGDWRAALVSADGQVNTSTQVGREFLGSLVDQGKEYRTLAQTAFDTALRQGQGQEQATEAARRAVGERREQFMGELRDMGFTETQARRLADAYLGMPKDVRTLISLHGVSDAENQIAYLTRTRFITVHVQQGAALQPVDSRGRPVGRAFLNQGGLVPGGGPDRDSVPAVLTPGEFVVKRTAARRHLPLLEAINRAAGGDDLLTAMRATQLDAGPRGAATSTAWASGAVTAQASPRAVLELRSDGSRLSELLIEVLRHAVRIRGGDVQLVLGGGR